MLSVMEAMGVNTINVCTCTRVTEQCLYPQWVKTLLTHTCACTYKNGVAPGMREFTAGVRQGCTCPLSPLLYFFVGEALFRYLQSEQIGVTVHDVNIIATQIADDTQVLLPSPVAGHRVCACILAIMDTMAAAFGQQLNLN